MEIFMRITNSLLFNASIRNYRNSTEKLYDINQQIATKLKIQNSYENTSVYVDAMRLNNEIDTLQQSLDSSSKAKTFADNTDTTLTSFSSALDQFKAKLIQASNTSNSTTSLQALANDLKGLKGTMVNLANTSINGQFLFSGSALSQKPINADGTYNGNSESLTALIGSGVELPYNITGQSLFLGKDTDYNRVVSTNIGLYNQAKLHPDVMSVYNQNDIPTKTYLQDTDTIRDLVGDTNNLSTDDPKAVFYLSGRKSDGSTFSNPISIDTSSKISDLLESIGNSYGNTATNKIVNVSMNERGQIEIKDLKSGSQLLDMNIFGAIDRTALPGQTGDAMQIMNIDKLLTYPNVEIISFSKSNYGTMTSPTAIIPPAVVGVEIPDGMNYTRRGFEKDGNTLTSNVSQTIKNTSDFATAGTKLVDVAGVDSLNGKQMVLDYTDKNGIKRTGTLTFDSSNTTFSVDLDGDGLTTSPNETFSIYNGKSDPLNLNTTADEMTYKQLTDIISMATSGNLPKEGISTTAQTAINDAITFGIAGDTINLDAQTALAKTGVSSETAKYIQKAIDAGILRDNPASTPTVVAKATLDYNNAIGNAKLAEYNNTLSTAKNSVEVSLDYQGKITIQDKTASQSKINFTMYDSAATDFTGIGSSALTFMANNAVAISNPSIDMFKQLDEMIAAVSSGNFRMDSTTLGDPRNMGIQNALTQLDHIADHVTKAQTQIGSLTNALNDANTRSTLLSVNVKSIQNSVIGVDTAEAYLELQSITTSFEAMLSTMAKVNSMSLLTYMQ